MSLDTLKLSVYLPYTRKGITEFLQARYLTVDFLLPKKKAHAKLRRGRCHFEISYIFVVVRTLLGTRFVVQCFE